MSVASTHAAVIQLACTSNEQRNWAAAERLIRRAAACGAQLIATPENTNFLGPHHEKVQRAESLAGPTITHFSKLASELGITLLLGSFNERSDDPQRCYNTSVLFEPSGTIAATYRKIHLFDVNVSEGVCFVESDTVKPGTSLTVAQTPLGALGLSICYDLRFPEFYQALAQRGAQILSVPSAFTLMTGKDHWEVLLRARAIENQCYVLAPGQCGRHDDDGLRHSYGHSIIIDPWGHVIAKVSDGEGFALAEINLERLRDIRKAMPVADHRRLSSQ